MVFVKPILPRMDSLERKKDESKPCNNNYFALNRSAPYIITIMVGAAHLTKSYLLAAVILRFQHQVAF